MKDNNFSLRNKTILVTGATSGIGLEICKQISNAEGRFIGMGRNIDTLQRYIEDNKLQNCQCIYCDLSRGGDVDTIVSKLSTKLDGIVHAAGVTDLKPMRFFDLEDYEVIRKVNLDSILLLYSQILKGKKLNRGASTVFISSIAAIRGAKGHGIYAITKAALDGISRVLASELSSRGIRVNTVQPGAVDTDMSQKIESVLTKEVMDKDRDNYPLGYGNVRDIALPVVFLLSDASKWITGQSIVIDGGRTSLI